VFAGFLDVPDLVKRFLAARRPGSYLAVERPGEVAVGDRVTVLARPGHGVTVADVMAAMSGHRELVPFVATARDDMRERGRDWLDEVLAASRS
jgi:MOSC domain-containing protein YiiM